MSTKDILRKYLDILEADDSAEKPATTDTSKGIKPPAALVVPPEAGSGSVEAVRDALKDYQAAKGIEPADGKPTAPTIAALLSDFGGLNSSDSKKLQAGDEYADKVSGEAEPVAEGMDGMGASKQEQLTEKAALHLGYAHGLMGHDIQCPHNVGTSAHSHYCHGHNLGLKECGPSWKGGAGSDF